MLTPRIGPFAAAAILCALFPPTLCSAIFAPDKPPSPTESLSPSDEATRRNAFKIFNALHAATRQWGSSLDHNGMSFFLATVPEGSVFFHGTTTPDRPQGMEWLAFEIEHAQSFAESQSGEDDESWSLGASGKQDAAPEARQRHDLLRYEAHGRVSLLNQPAPPRTSLDDQQHPMELSDSRTDGGDDDEVRTRMRMPSKPYRGYLQTFRASRQLNLLYLDGMAAGKSPYGTLDTQDYVLLDWDVEEGERRPLGFGWADELKRAHQLCEVVAKQWEDAGTPIDGFVRMEAGFEIIYCHFEDGGGLERVSVDTSPFKNETVWVDPVSANFEWLRACTLRYNGFPADKITIDWSSMVSAFFYDLNITNPDATRPELPRVVNTTRSQRQALKQKVDEVIADRFPAAKGQQDWPLINWQGVVDAVVARYSDRLAGLASDTLSAGETRYMINSLLSPFTNSTGSASDRPSLDRCTSLYLEPALAHNGTGAWTAKDELIAVAVGEVTGRICSVLIDAWAALNTNTAAANTDHNLEEVEEEEKGVAAVVGRVKELVGQLSWSTWHACGQCASPREICFVAMFPIGGPEDHYAPRCRNASELYFGTGGNYWLDPKPKPGSRKA